MTSMFLVHLWHSCPVALKRRSLKLSETDLPVTFSITMPSRTKLVFE